MARDDDPERTLRERPLRRLRVVVLLLVLPLSLLGPLMAKGELFLPWLPVGLQPLADERPEEAALAFKDANFPQADRVFPVLTDQIAMREEIARGRLPLWEPLFGLGVPLHGGSIAAATYPPNWLAFLLPPEIAAAPLAVLSLFLAGLGTWLFLGRLGFSRHGALVAAAAVQVGGWGIANLYYYMKVDAALWLPWSLWAVEGLRARKPWSGFALTLSVGLSMLAGFVTVALFSLGFTAVYAALRWFATSPWLDPGASPSTGRAPRPAPSGLAAVALFCALGVAAGGVQLLPSFEASRESLRSHRSAADLATESLPAAALLGTAIPDLFGAPTEATPPGDLPVPWWLTPPSEMAKAERANQLEWNTWIGGCVVLLALVGLVAAPRRAALPAAALALVFGFAMGVWPLRWLYHLPGLNIGAPHRVLALAWLLWPWLAALGLERLRQGAPRAQRTLLLASFAGAVVFFLLWTSFDPPRFAARFEETLLARYGHLEGITRDYVRERFPPALVLAAGQRLVRSFAHVFGACLATLAGGLFLLLAARPRPRFAGPLGRTPVVLGVVVACLLLVAPMGAWSFPAGKRAPATSTALLGAALLCGAAWTRRRRGQPDALLPLFAVVALEGLLAANGHVTGRVSNGLPVFPPSPAIEAIRTAAGDGRVLRYDPTPSGVADVERLARPNMLQPYGIADLTAWTVFTPRRLNELCEALDPRMRFRTGISSLRDAALLDHRLLDLLRVTAVLSRRPLDHPRLTPVLDRPDFHVSHRSGAQPLARIVPRLVPVPDDRAAVRAVLAGRPGFDEGAVVVASEAPPELGPPAADFRAGRITSIERPSRDRLAITVAGGSGGWLILHEEAYPGWRARVNGEPVPVLRADHVCRAVRLPAGDARVELWYAPASLYWGLSLSVLAPLLALFLSRRLGG